MAEEIKTEEPEIQTVRTQLKSVNEWISDEFSASVIARAGVQAAQRKIREKKLELERQIRESSQLGDIEQMIALNSILQGLINMAPLHMPEIPKQEAQKAIENARRAVSISITRVNQQLPNPPINGHLMRNHPHAIKCATIEERAAKRAWNEFNMTVYLWRETTSNWMTKNHSEPFVYLLEGASIITHDCAKILQEANEVQAIVSKGDSMYRNIFIS